MRKAVAVVLCFCLLSFSVRAQESPPVSDDVNPVQVEDAIKRGIAYLKGRVDGLAGIGTQVHATRLHELVLWTFIHAGVPEDDEKFVKLLKYIVEKPLERTYLVSLQAMILEELDRVYYQMRIAQCAQFLADNQCDNGQWLYGQMTSMPDGLDVPTVVRVRTATTAGAKSELDEVGRRRKPKVTRFIPVKRSQKGPPTGDNSNSQYAALGLRACVDAGIVFESSVIQKARAWWEADLNEDGGWCYAGHPDHKESYGSMTAGGVGSLCIYRALTKRPWKKDPKVLKGLKWLEDHFTVEENPGTHEDHEQPKGWRMWHFYYYLYAMERAALLYGTDQIGPHRWYPAGARKLLSLQAEGGNWDTEVNTCFAVLFLRRATRPLEDVATGGSSKKK